LGLTADLSGRTALVTGASGGLGAHFARVLARHGAAVVLAARRVDRLEGLAAEIAAAGGRAHPVAMDVTASASVDAAIRAAEEALGTAVDVLVNNSGVSGRGARLLDLEDADVGGVLDVNLTGAFRVAKAVVLRLVEAGSPAAS
jgi:NAD(P)-dependent dehydrogenase (short-subunit alcohol dehydrogenase family)